ncbi:MAG: monovalent cation/H+ antiporter subunit D family protein [Nevskiales bacterium]
MSQDKLVPLLAAPLCVLLGRPASSWLLACVAAWASFVIALLLTSQVMQAGPVSYAMGGWAAPVGIEYQIDALSAFLLLIISGSAAVVLPWARQSIAAEIPADRIHLFYALMLLTITGMLGIVSTGDAFNVFVFLEIASLSGYALVAMGTQQRALMAAFQYLIMGTIGGTFILIAIGLLYSMTGTLNMADLAVRLPAVADTRPVQAALAFLVIGASLKLALFPLHLWLPNAYATAPSAVSALLAGTSTKVAAYVLIRFLYTVFGGEWSLAGFPLDTALITLAILAMLTGSAVAVLQTDIKRLLAWSSLAQIGYIVLGLALLSNDGLAASILHLLNHAVIKTALFLCVGVVALRCGGVSLTHFAGLGRRLPLTMAALLVAGLGLIGVPGTAGFVSKWALLQALLAGEHWYAAIAMLLSSLLAVAYVWRLVEVIYFKAAGNQADASASTQIVKVPGGMLACILLLVALSVALGLQGGPVLEYCRAAATALIGGASG